MVWPCPPFWTPSFKSHRAAVFKRTARNSPRSPITALPSVLSFVSLPFLFWLSLAPIVLPRESPQQIISLTSWSEHQSFHSLGHPSLLHFSPHPHCFIMTCECPGDREGIVILRVCLVPCNARWACTASLHKGIVRP